MVGETKDPSNPKEVAASVFGAVVVYAVRILILQLSQSTFSISSVALVTMIEDRTTILMGMNEGKFGKIF